MATKTQCPVNHAAGGGMSNRDWWLCPVRWLTWASICQPKTSIKPGARPGRSSRIGYAAKRRISTSAPERTAKSATA
jgi:hypothetical protein